MKHSINTAGGLVGVVTGGTCRKFGQELGRPYRDESVIEAVREFTSERQNPTRSNGHRECITDGQPVRESDGLIVAMKRVMIVEQRSPRANDVST